MRILLVAHGYPPTVGGVESHLWDLSHRLARRGYEVCCLVGDGGPGATGLPLAVRRDANLSAGFLIARRRGRRPDELDRSLLDLVGSSIGKAIADAQPDVVHAHNLHRFAPEPAHALLAEASVPVVHTVHDVVSDTTNPGVLALPWTHTVCVSAHLRDSLRSTL